MHPTVNGIAVTRMGVVENYKQPLRRMTYSTPFLNGVDIGSEVAGSFVINGVTTNMFNGYVKTITRRRPENVYEVAASDILVRAVEYWFAPTNLEEGWTKRNILHYNLVDAILGEATITDFQNDWGADADLNPYTGEARGSFTFATGDEPVRIKIASAWDVIQWICTITGSHVYADIAGTVHLGLIWDEPLTPQYTIQNVMTMIEYSKSDENLRNKVVVYGSDGSRAEASAVSPYLPVDFYKVAVISHELIDGAMAQETADLNLHRMNKLTESCVIDVLGDTKYTCRQTVEVVNAKAGVSGNWFVTQCAHNMSDSGYITRLTVTK